MQNLKHIMQNLKHMIGDFLVKDYSVDQATQMIDRMFVWATAAITAFAIFVAIWFIVSAGKKERRRAVGGGTLFIGSLLIFLFLFSQHFALAFYEGIKNLAEGSDKLVVGTVEAAVHSIIEALRTFGITEEYPTHIEGIRSAAEMVERNGNFWVVSFSAFNLLAPIAGGALIIQLISDIFPGVRLFLACHNPFRPKYYFSALTEQTVALVRSYAKKDRKWYIFQRPILIITDAYADRSEEKSSELLAAAKAQGAICVRDDLVHVHKNFFRKRTFFLMDEDDMANLHTFSELTEGTNARYLKKAQVYFFSQEDMYTCVEQSIRDKLKSNGIKDAHLPIIHPVRIQQNLIFKLLEDLPLYEPLIGKEKAADGKTELNVTVLGTGYIGTEMVLSTYWCSQMLDVRTTINVISKEAENDFFAKLNYISPEILRSTVKDDPILNIYADAKKKAEPYCTIRYYRADLDSEEGMELLVDAEKSKAVSAQSQNGDVGDQPQSKRTPPNLMRSDYFLVSLGTDRKNIQIANSLRRLLGRGCMSGKREERSIVAYVVYDSALCNLLNQQGGLATSNNVYAKAIGSLEEIYNADSISMTPVKYNANAAGESYRRRTHGKQLAELCQKRAKDEYAYWSDVARAVHLKYKMYSLGMINQSLFTTPVVEELHGHYLEAANNYLKFLREWKELTARKAAFDAQNAKTAEPVETVENCADACTQPVADLPAEPAAEIVSQPVQDTPAKSGKKDKDVPVTWSEKDQERLKELQEQIDKLTWLEHRRWNAFIRGKGFVCPEDFTKYYAKLKSHKHMSLRLHPCLVECDDIGLHTDLKNLEKPHDLLDTFSCLLFDEQVEERRQEEKKEKEEKKRQEEKKRTRKATRKAERQEKKKEKADLKTQKQAEKTESKRVNKERKNKLKSEKQKEQQRKLDAKKGKKEPVEITDYKFYDRPVEDFDFYGRYSGKTVGKKKKK